MERKRGESNIHMKNEQVVENWTQGRQGKSLHMETDGKSLFSYEMKIGETWRIDASKQERNIRDAMKHGLHQKVGLNVQTPFFYSQTTSKHVGLVRRYAHKMINPKIIRNGWYIWYLFP